MRFLNEREKPQKIVKRPISWRERASRRNTLLVYQVAIWELLFIDGGYYRFVNFLCMRGNVLNWIVDTYDSRRSSVSNFLS